ncbi:MAG: RimK/LysX family protein [Photobacterium frigidiphilum]|uniref:ATP-dependent zinc protease family protein n=1 Tax=Photobacterium frigidiphilum TaxID=264736 RepID=UPI0030011DEF
MAFLRLITALCLSVISISPSIAQGLPQETIQKELTMIDDKVVLGRIEKVSLPNITALNNIGIPAKIDTGADSTSIHAENIKITATDSIFNGLEGKALLDAIAVEFDALTSTKLRDREDKTDIMVSFDLIHPYSGDTIAVTLPLFRLAMIKSRGEGHLARPVVELSLQIAGKTVLTEVNLTDRTRFSYPILIGKTFLQDTAWVNAGYDYLQEQDTALIIGRKERALINDISLETSVSFTNRYSILHALNIKVDEKAKQVSFTLEGDNKQHKKMTVPLVKMLKFSNAQRPLVYIPVQLGSIDDNAFNKPILVYLRDRSKNSSQLRLGTEALNQNFIVDLGNTYLTERPIALFSSVSGDKTSFIMSPKEQITIDGITVNAKPSAIIKTPLLKVSHISEDKKDTGRMVNYALTDINNDVHTLEKPIKRKIRVGDDVRPIVVSEITLPSSLLIKDIALKAMSANDNDPSRFDVTPNLVHGSLLINTRTTNLIHNHAALKAGYIEQAQVAGLSFPVKLDTGADVSSMHATDIKAFVKDDKKWVSFTYTNASNVKKTLTKEVIDEMRIKGRVGEKSNVRLVVNMQVTLGSIEKEIAVNLRDRSRFKYSMILGKNFLNNDIIVSSDQQFMLTSNASL